MALLARYGGNLQFFILMEFAAVHKSRYRGDVRIAQVETQNDMT